MPRKQYYVYIMSNKRNTVLYAGITSDLEHRVREHKGKSVKGFTSRYNVDKLVYFEELNNPEEAIMREKQIKAGSRKKKIELIENVNEKWKDLSKAWYL